MKKNLKMSAAILAAVMVMGSLTACGGSSSDPTTAAAAKDTTAADVYKRQPQILIDNHLQPVRRGAQRLHGGGHNAVVSLSLFPARCV